MYLFGASAAETRMTLTTMGNSAFHLLESALPPTHHLSLQRFRPTRMHHVVSDTCRLSFHHRHCYLQIHCFHHGQICQRTTQTRVVLL